MEYCPACTCPLEYCEHAACARVAASALANVNLERADEGKSSEASAVTDADAVVVSEGAVEGEGAGKKPSSGKKGKGKAKEVVITRMSRNRKKMITNVAGLELFDVDLKEASKAFGKKFACGCSVTKGATGKDELDLQGDYSEQLAELIAKTYAVEEDAIKLVDKSKF